MIKLIKVRYIDYSGDYAFAPPTLEGVINLWEVSKIVTIRPENTRSSDALVRITFRDGTSLDVVGKPADFIVEDKP